MLLLALLLAQTIGNTTPPGVRVQDEGVDKGRARTLNCVGTGIVCSVSAGVGTLTVAGGGGSTTVTQVTVDLGLMAMPSFTATITDAGVTATSKIVVVQDGSAISASTIVMTNNNTSGSCTSSTTKCTITTAGIVANRATVVGVALENITGPRVVSLTDSAGTRYTRRGYVSDGAATSIEIWTGIPLAPATTVDVVLDSVAGTAWEFGFLQYSGVVAFGFGGAATTSGAGTTASVSLTTLDANNFAAGPITCQFGLCNGLNGLTGTQWISGAGYVFMDNTSVAPGSTTIAATLNSSTDWSAAAVELRTLAKSADENELDAFTCSASPAAGSFVLNCTAVGTLLTGQYRANYLFQ